MSHFAVNYCQTHHGCTQIRGIIAIPLTLIVIGNVLLRLYHKCSKASAIVDAAMSAVAPVKFFIADGKNKHVLHMSINAQGN